MAAGSRRRISYGTSPWGKRFLETLEAGNDPDRLQRGRTYANTGKVADFSINGPQVAAKVAGNYQPWYKVKLTYPAFSDAERQAVLDCISADPVLVSEVKGGILPESLLDMLDARGIELIPRDWQRYQRSCNCPDYGDPCKHMAALYYMMVREIDQNPQALFLLRGLDLAAAFPAMANQSLPGLFRQGASLSPEPDRDDTTGLETSFLPFFQALLRHQPGFYPHGDFKISLLACYHASLQALGAWVPPAVPDLFAPAPARRGSKVAAPPVIPHDPVVWLLESRASLVDAPGWSKHYRGNSLPNIALQVELEHSLGGKRTIALIDLMAALLALEEEPADPWLLFCQDLAHSLWRLLSASALRPRPWMDREAMHIAWQALESQEAVRNELVRLVPPQPLPGLDAPSTVEFLVTALLSEWIHGLGRWHPVRPNPVDQAFFAAGTLDTGSNAWRSSPLAIHAWLAILDLSPRPGRYRLVLEELAQEEIAFALRVLVRLSPDDPWADPVQSPTLLAHEEVRDFLAMLGAYLGELALLRQGQEALVKEDRLLFFLQEAAPVLTRLGVDLQLPKSLAKALRPKLTVSARPKDSGSLESNLGLDTLLEYQWTIAIGDATCSLEEFAALADESARLVRIRDQYALLDPQTVRSLLEQARRPVASTDLIEAWLDESPGLVPAARRQLDELFSHKDTPPPATIHAELRHYQLQGFRWAWNNLHNGFGCLLADDMGLGKTLQAICIIAQAQLAGCLDKGCLVIVPASLLVNWQRELQRFAPTLDAGLYYGPKRRLDPGQHVTLSTYETISRDIKTLEAHPFSLLILDEAHGLKNCNTKRAQAMRRLDFAMILALSGTPVENRLEDLRALFDLVQPGYLGEQVEFRQRWRIPIELHRDAATAERLRRLTSPFLMRRLKTDPGIAPELPPKTVIDEYATMSLAQSALYQAVLAELAGDPAVFAVPGKRQALVLKLLTALKQVCNHPRCYDQESPGEASLSGKALLLLDLLRGILESREKVLIFSQYVSTLELLKSIIARELGEDCIMLHGGMGQHARKAAVDRFQSDSGCRIFLISLKAGGVGLNLTAASRVIHYDLWYNPAVEDQASDRAFRIGQTRQVFVHRLITTGSFEEKIDALIKSRQELAAMGVATGETWLADLDPGELLALFQPD